LDLFGLKYDGENPESKWYHIIVWMKRTFVGLTIW
jgi:hypothetical protein